MGKLRPKKLPKDKDGNVYDSFEVSLAYSVYPKLGDPDGLTTCAITLTPFRESGGKILTYPEEAKRFYIGDIKNKRYGKREKDLITSLENTLQALVDQYI